MTSVQLAKHILLYVIWNFRFTIYSKTTWYIGYKFTFRHINLCLFAQTRIEPIASQEEQLQIALMRNSFEDKWLTLREMEDCLPKQNGLYLRIILGPVDVSFNNKQDKFEYKNNYENFKITVSAIISLFALFLYFFNSIR